MSFTLEPYIRIGAIIDSKRLDCISIGNDNMLNVLKIINTVENVPVLAPL